MALVFIETSVFTKQIVKLMDDDEYIELQLSLIKQPDCGRIIPGCGGIRKMRWAAKGKGKRGGSRIIYYWVKNEQQVFMLLAYPKNEQEDLSSEQKRSIKALVEAWLK